MKIVRFLSDKDEPQLGAQHEDGSVTRIEGCIFSEHHDTGDPATVKKLLAPVQPTAVLCIGLNYRKHAKEGGADYPGTSGAVHENAEHCAKPRRPDFAANQAQERRGGLRVRVGGGHRHETVKMSRRPTRLTMCLAIPAPTTSVRATGKRAAAAANGAAVKRSTHSVRLARCW